MKGLSISLSRAIDLRFHSIEIEQRLGRKRVHAPDEISQVALDDEVLAALHECLHRTRRAAADMAEHPTKALPCEIGILLGPDSANSFSMIFRVRMNQVCSWPVFMM